MEDQLYIVFAEHTGEDESGNQFYRILLSNDPEIVWGDNFDISPSGIIPNLEPDSNSIKKEYLLTTKLRMRTAVESTWFSLQDCIDGIIALLFCGEDEKIVAIPFGMEFEKVEDYVKWFGGEMKEVEYIPKVKEEDGEEQS